MATINEITAGNSYTGNSALGGSSTGVFDIDTRPVQQLAQYTFLYNKSQYDQRQKDADEAVKKLADLAPYDLVNGLPKDKEELIDAQAKLSKDMADYAAQGTPKTPQEKLRREIDFQSKIQGQLKKIKGANERLISYNLHKAAIEALPEDAAVKAEKLKMLDKQVADTDIYTPIQALPNFDLTIPKVAPPVYKTQDAQAIGANNNVEQTLTSFDGPANYAASLIESGPLAEMLTPPPANATELEKQQYALRAKSKGGSVLWQDAANFLNKAIQDPNYKKTQTNMAIVPELATQSPSNEIDFEAIKKDNPLAGNIISLYDRYNEAAKLHNEGNWVIDEKGYKVILPNEPDKQWPILDITKGLKPSDIVYLEKFSQAQPDKIDSKVTHTGDANTLRNINLDYAATIAGQKNAKEIANLPYISARIGSGTATKDEKSTYPILKTQELVDVIGVDTEPKNFTDLTPEMQSKITTQIGDRIDPSNFNTAKISIKGDNIIVSGTTGTGKDAKAISINIKPDDITKDYYNEVNKNDAGKEAPERRYFKIGDKPKTPAPAADGKPKVDEYGVPIK